MTNYFEYMTPEEVDKMVRQVVYKCKFKGCPIEDEDLYQMGYEGYLTGVKNFEKHSHDYFKNSIWHAIKYEIVKNLQKEYKKKTEGPILDLDLETLTMKGSDGAVIVPESSIALQQSPAKVSTDSSRKKAYKYDQNPNGTFRGADFRITNQCNVENSILLDRVRRALFKLKPEDATLIQRYYIQSDTLATLSAELGVSKERVRQKCNKAVQRLQEILGNE